MGNHVAIYAKYPLENLGLRQGMDFTVDKLNVTTIVNPEQHEATFRKLIEQALYNLPGRLLDKPTSILEDTRQGTIQLLVPPDVANAAFRSLREGGWQVRAANELSSGYVSPRAAGPDADGTEPIHDHVQDPPHEGTGPALRRVAA